MKKYISVFAILFVMAVVVNISHAAHFVVRKHSKTENAGPNTTVTVIVSTDDSQGSSDGPEDPGTDPDL